MGSGLRHLLIVVYHPKSSTMACFMTYLGHLSPWVCWAGEHLQVQHHGTATVDKSWGCGVGAKPP